MTSSRTKYSALTPNVPTFSINRPSNSHFSGTRDGSAGVDRNVDTLKVLNEMEEGEIDDDEVAPRISIWGQAKARFKANTGLLLIAASQAFFSLMNVAVKKLNTVDPPVSALQLIAVRMTITYICCMTYMLAAKVPDPFLGPKGVRALLVFRGFTGFFGLFGVYYSLQYLSLSDATVLTFLAPMCTAVTGALLLGETLTKRQALAGMVSLIGVVMIARPASLFGKSIEIPSGDAAVIPLTKPGPRDVTPAQRLVAVSVALIGVLGATGAYTTLRAIGKRAHPLHALTSFSLQCVCVSSIAMIVKHEPFIVPTRPEWLGMLAMIGIFGFLAQVLLTLGLQRETASRGSMAVYTQIVFATAFERVFFDIKPSLLSAIGTTMIISSAIYVAWTKKPEEQKIGGSVSLQRVSDGLEHGLLDDMNGDSEMDPQEPQLHRTQPVDLEQDDDSNLTLCTAKHRTASTGPRG